MVLLIDTNILLDVLQERKPHFESSFGIWGLCEYDPSVTGYISAISPSNIAYIMRKELTPERMQNFHDARNGVQVRGLRTGRLGEGC